MEACQHHSTQVVVLTQRTPAPAYNAVADSPVCAALQCHGRLACPPVRPVHASAPIYNKEDNLPVRTGLQRCGRLSRPHQRTMSRPTYLSEPPLMLRSSLSSISRGMVYINIPGRTCLHELFIEYEQVTAWVARFFFQQNGGKLSYTINRCLHWVAQWAGAQVAATTVWLTSNHQLEGTIGRVADTAHTGSFITRRSHFNLLWIHIALSTPMIYTLCYGQYGESQSQLLESS